MSPQLLKVTLTLSVTHWQGDAFLHMAGKPEGLHVACINYARNTLMLNVLIRLMWHL